MREVKNERKNSCVSWCAGALIASAFGGWTGAITTNATIEITTSGEFYIIFSVAIREDGTTGLYGRININSCFLEVLKFDLAATATTTEGGE